MKSAASHSSLPYLPALGSAGPIVSSKPPRLAGQGAIQIESRTDQREMAERLRKIAELVAPTTRADAR